MSKKILVTAALLCIAAQQAFAGNELVGTEVCNPIWIQEGPQRMITNGCSPYTPGADIGLKQVWQCFSTADLCQQAATTMAKLSKPYGGWAGCPFLCSGPYVQ
jgi:hypothetical protein